MFIDLIFFFQIKIGICPNKRLSGLAYYLFMLCTSCHVRPVTSYTRSERLDVPFLRFWNR
jgi:hypothetical protein